MILFAKFTSYEKAFAKFATTNISNAKLTNLQAVKWNLRNSQNMKICEDICIDFSYPHNLS